MLKQGYETAACVMVAFTFMFVFVIFISRGVTGWPIMVSGFGFAIWISTAFGVLLNIAQNIYNRPACKCASTD